MKIRTMELRLHVRLLTIVTIAWFLFWVAGLPDYYQQYSSTSMVIFDLAVLPPIWFLIYRRAKRSGPGRGMKVCLWWAFYISVPLFIYDLIYCGLYLGHGATFLTKYWYLTVYYILPWIIFPPTGWFIDKKSKLAMWETAEQQERTMCNSDFQGAGAGDHMWHKFVAPHRKTLDMGNYTMHYIDIGQGEPVVMVHGMMLSTYSWRNNIQALLDADFRVILVDVPGHG